MSFFPVLLEHKSMYIATMTIPLLHEAISQYTMICIVLVNIIWHDL